MSSGDIILQEPEYSTFYFTYKYIFYILHLKSEVGTVSNYIGKQILLAYCCSAKNSRTHIRCLVKSKIGKLR